MGKRILECLGVYVCQAVYSLATRAFSVSDWLIVLSQHSGRHVDARGERSGPHPQIDRS